MRQTAWREKGEGGLAARCCETRAPRSWPIKMMGMGEDEEEEGSWALRAERSALPMVSLSGWSMGGLPP